MKNWARYSLQEVNKYLKMFKIWDHKDSENCKKYDKFL